MHGRRNPLLPILLLVALGLPGCLGMDLTDPMGTKAEFDEIQSTFAKFIRWGAIDEASAFVVREQREAFLELSHELTDMRFTDYEVEQLDYGDDFDNATVRVRYSGYRLSSPIETSFRIVQEWEKEPESGAWQVRLDVAQLRQALAR